MSNEKHETVADIVAEMRKRAEEVYAGQAGYPESWKDQMNDDEIREIADRIEAAHKREREAGAEAAQICGEIGEIVGRDDACRQPVTYCHGVNTAAMREALVMVKRLFDGRLMWQPDIRKAHEAVNAALAATPRNFDVGTTKEHSARFDAHCRKHMGCLTCPLREKDGGVPKHCEFAWSQMPYDEVEK